MFFPRKSRGTDQLCYANIKNKNVHLVCVQPYTTSTHTNAKAVEQALISLLRPAFITKSVGIRNDKTEFYRKAQTSREYTEFCFHPCWASNSYPAYKCILISFLCITERSKAVPCLSVCHLHQDSMY